jgi:hypothetical protein
MVIRRRNTIGCYKEKRHEVKKFFPYEIYKGTTYIMRPNAEPIKIILKIYFRIKSVG